MITKKGREIAQQLGRVGAVWHWEEADKILNSLSLICRHAKTYRRLQEIQCGDGIHSGEWVNENWDAIQKRDDQIESRLLTLAKDLPFNVAIQLDGDPRGLVVRLIVTDNLGVPRTVEVE
jgi:hypothetical protein